MSTEAKRNTPVRLVAALLAALAVLSASSVGSAAPEAHILRIDPRASLVDGAPILTTVIELVQNKRMADITSKCAYATGNGNFDCISDELLKKHALYTPLVFPEQNAIFTVHVDGKDMPASYVSRAKWGDAAGQDGVGTAWLILVDAAASMGGRFGEAKEIAKAFINGMGPADIVDVMFFNDRTVVNDSKWLGKKAQAAQFVDGVTRTYPAQGRTRQLFNIIKQGATDGFRELGNTGSGVDVPMHQALVVLSNGASGTDTGSPAQSALLLQQYMTKGRFPEDNKTLPKAPVPIISVWFPKLQTEELFQNARQFMENLADFSIGGFYSIVRDGQAHKASAIATAVRRRFNEMHIVKWRVPCIAPTITQTFRLVFKNTNPVIAGDNFENVPVGIDPSTWPLDIDYPQTEASAKKNKVHPGGSIKIYGNFCWGSDHKRAQLYMIPKNQPAPTSLKGKSIEEAKKIQKQLIATNMVGKAERAGDAFVEFEVPDSPKFLQGSGNKTTARLVVVDTNAYRTSAITADKILTLPAEKKPFNLLLIGGLTFGGIVLILLIVQIFMGKGGARGRRGGRPGPPGPVGPMGPGPMGPGPMGPHGPPGPMGPMGPMGPPMGGPPGPGGYGR